MLDLLPHPFVLIVLALVIFALATGLRSIGQSTVGVVTLFGKYHRVMREGLNFKWPWEKVHKVTIAKNVLRGYVPHEGLLAHRVPAGQAGGGPAEVC